MEAALEKARSQVLSGAQIIHEKERILPSQKILEVQAFEEGTAKAQVAREIGITERIDCIELKARGNKGVFGIGKKPNIYEVKTRQSAVG